MQEQSLLPGSLSRQMLQLDDKADLRPLIGRFIRGEVTNSGYFAAIHLVFWKEIVAGDYPLPFLTWLERAYSAYDLSDTTDGLGKRDGLMVRALLAEAQLLFDKPDPNAAITYRRYEAARRLMLGMSLALTQRTRQLGGALVTDGISHLTEAIRQFGTVEIGERSTPSDDFHMACALYMVDWLASEIPDGETQRGAVLAEMDKLGAVRAYECLVEQSNNWGDRYNITEIYGKVEALPNLEPRTGRARTGLESMILAIELNPRLAVFDLATGFDGIDEPLRDAMALQNIIPVIERERPEWLAQHVNAYHNHAALYAEDISKGIKAMQKELRLTKKGLRSITKRIAGAVILAIGTLAASGFLFVAMAASKPIFL